MPLFSQAQKTVLYNQGLELERHFQRDKIIWTSFSNEARVEVEVVCKNGKKYILRVCISPDFPNSCPPMVVISPDGVLRRANGSLLGLASRQLRSRLNKQRWLHANLLLPSRHLDGE